MSLSATDPSAIVVPTRNSAMKINMDENELIEKVKNLKQKELIRKIGPKINIKKLEKRVTALLAARVKSENIDDVVKEINQLNEVSHNYERTHDYNIWFTLSAKDQESFEKIINKISHLNGIDDIISLPTIKFFKLNVRFNQFTNFNITIKPVAAFFNGNNSFHI